MRYYLDTEFDGPCLISLALVSEDGRKAYAARDIAPFEHRINPWVLLNVVPVIACPGAIPDAFGDLVEDINDLISGDAVPVFVADWPTDFQHFLPLLHDDMGNMIINIPSFSCRVERVDAYPTSLPGAVQHNALWDARALRHKMQGDAA